MPIREPLPVDTHKHKCPLPEVQVEPKSYFECDCGRDYVARDLPSWTDAEWRRVHWWNRSRIRRSVGIDEKCPDCGYRSYKNFRRWIEASQRAGGSVMVGYLCRMHERQRHERLSRNPPPPMWPI